MACVHEHGDFSLLLFFAVSGCSFHGDGLSDVDNHLFSRCFRRGVSGCLDDGMSRAGIQYMDAPSARCARRAIDRV